MADNLSEKGLMDIKDVNDLEEIGKVHGKNYLFAIVNEKSKRVSIDTIAGYIASTINAIPGSASTLFNDEGGNVLVIPKGESIPVNRRIPGNFYIEECDQVSIRSQINLPISVKISKQMGLKRV